MFTQLLKAAFLGVLQGLTEFLPISSTGHLVLGEHLLGISQEKFGLSFDAAIHLGTALSVFWFFRKKWGEILSSFCKDIEKIFDFSVIPAKAGIYKKEKLWFYLLAGTIPAAIIGLFLEQKIETVFRQPKIVAFALLFGSLIIFSAERLGKRKKKLEKVNLLSAIFIGFSQSLALIPGISRSGVTISSGMFLSFKRKSAAEFAFLLSGPIVLGAGGKKLLDVLGSFASRGFLVNELLFFLIGIICAAISGFLTIKFLLKYLSCHSLDIFVAYRVLLAFLVLIFLT